MQNENVPQKDKDASTPPACLQGTITGLNIAVTSMGVVSTGLLAMLITHRNLTKQELDPGLIGTADIISFATAMLGKIAIILFFNQAVVSARFNELYKKGFIAFFKIKKKPVLEHIGWTINYIMSLNASVFWSGLVQRAFSESASILAQMDSEAAKNAAKYIGQWYVFVPFMLCSLYANGIAWLDVHQSAIQQKKRLFQWLFERRAYHNFKDTMAFQIDHAQQKLLKELKTHYPQGCGCCCTQEEEDIASPQLDALIEALAEKDHRTAHPDASTPLNEKLAYVIHQTKNNPQLLRRAYLKSDASSTDAVSTLEWSLRQGTAFLMVGVTIWGFQNVLGLSDVIWGQWGAAKASIYFIRYLTFYSMIELTLVTVYPMIDKLGGIVKHGIPSHVFSGYTLSAILAVVAFVGILGGLANAEQSYLDNESIPNIVIADVAAFLMDAFSIYMVLRKNIERWILSRDSTDDHTQLKQHYLKIQELGDSARDLSALTELELLDLAKIRDNYEGITMDNENSDAEEGNSQNRFQMFYCLENPLRRCFGIGVEDEATPLTSLQT